MEITEERAIAKIIFWQQLTTILLTLFLLLFWGLFIKNVVIGLEYGYFSDNYLPNFFYLAFCLSATCTIYLLYQSLNFLKAYKREEEKLDLELAFKKQRHFWIALLLLLLCSILIGMGLLVLIIFSS